MKSRVHFISANGGEAADLLAAKADRVLRSTGFLDRIDAEDFVALKIHFGEKNNKGHIRPLWLRDIAASIRGRAPRAFLTDSNTLYVGRRSNSVEHIELAWSHDFRPDVLPLPVIIADGLIGRDVRESAGTGKRVAAAKIAGAILSADALLCLTHVTGHMQTGLGASLKNMGMGCASRAGKLDMHSVTHPRIQAKACRGCGLCLEVCPVGAVVLAEGRAVLDDAACIGCGECLVVCKAGAVKMRWDEDSRRVQEKIAEYAFLVRRHFGAKSAFLNFLIRITKDCDCMAKAEPPIVADIGILGSSDPVAADQAAADLVLERTGGRDVFRKGYDVDWSFQLKHGESLGLGRRDYELIRLD